MTRDLSKYQHNAGHATGLMRSNELSESTGVRRKAWVASLAKAFIPCRKRTQGEYSILAPLLVLTGDGNVVTWQIVMGNRHCLGGIVGLLFVVLGLRREAGRTKVLN